MWAAPVRLPWRSAWVGWGPTRLAHALGMAVAHAASATGTRQRGRGVQGSPSDIKISLSEGSLARRGRAVRHTSRSRGQWQAARPGGSRGLAAATRRHGRQGAATSPRRRAVMGAPGSDKEKLARVAHDVPPPLRGRCGEAPGRLPAWAPPSGPTVDHDHWPRASPAGAGYRNSAAGSGRARLTERYKDFIERGEPCAARRRGQVHRRGPAVRYTARPRGER